MKNKSFIDSVKALLPSGRAFDITQDKNMRRLFEAVAVLPDDIRDEIEKVYLDLFPDSTRSPEEWEKAFQVIFTQAELNQRRAVLQALWASNTGGQGLDVLQQVLRLVWPEINIFENIPTGNPRKSNFVYTCVCNYKTMVCGHRNAVCGIRIGDETFTPTILRNDTSSPYSIPNNADYWQFCFYVAKSVVRNSTKQILYVEKLEIPAVYKNYIEYLILRLKPVHTVAVLDIDWI